jgi:predicted dehydrogenase
LPDGHSEGYDDTFKQVFRRFYGAIEDPAAEPQFPQFSDGLRQLVIMDTETRSNRQHEWVQVPDEPPL